MTESEERIARLEEELADLKDRESLRESQIEAKQVQLSELIQVLLSLYGIIALLFTVCFEYRIAVESGFFTWLFFGSWFACILGALWPLTMWLLF
ncbi:MAG: hypothetical protein ACE37I_05475 [Rubinisphaera brasiliensis]|uniref:hypothetical protein n=1 Tax=Rubinisphaera brasiliensis TaxID=119 RepID=UPI00391B9044